MNQNPTFIKVEMSKTTKKYKIWSKYSLYLLQIYEKIGDLERI